LAQKSITHLARNSPKSMTSSSRVATNYSSWPYPLAKTLQDWRSEPNERTFRRSTSMTTLEFGVLI